MNMDFALETRLKELSPALSKNYGNIVLAMENILDKTASFYPSFTDHTLRHSLLVLESINVIVGDQMDKLNVDEIYILMCAAQMHDFGMTAGTEVFEKLKDKILPENFLEDHPDIPAREVIRRYHNDFSAEMIMRYAGVFEFPSEGHAYCVAQVSRGHRSADLFDRKEYDPDYKLDNGNRVCLPYLAALMRLCDEMDITSERNLPTSYLEHMDTMNYHKHFATKKMIIAPDRFIVKVQTCEPAVKNACILAIDKLGEELDYCNKVVDELTDFTISQKTIEIDCDDKVRKTAVILDTDCGIDDAMAMGLLNGMGDFRPDYIIATPGNVSLDQSVRNAIVLKKLYSFYGEIVRGEEHEDRELMGEKDTFHGDDGLGNVADKLEALCQVTASELENYITMDTLCEKLQDYEDIVYICICPLNSLSRICGDERLRGKISQAFLMGGGFREFNCAHDTEFNFSKAPKALGQMLKQGFGITLFPLDLTNHQVLTEDDIEALRRNAASDLLIDMLEYNRQSNISYNNIDGAVLHDALPMLYLIDSDQFEVVEMLISSDEYGGIHEDPQGRAVKVALGVRDGLVKEYAARIVDRKNIEPVPLNKESLGMGI